jgi:hypothetical protein
MEGSEEKWGRVEWNGASTGKTREGAAWPPRSTCGTSLVATPENTQPPHSIATQPPLRRSSSPSVRPFTHSTSRSVVFSAK